MTSFFSQPPAFPYGPSFGVAGSEEFQYTGKLLDSFTGLYLFGARYYDPETGRFATEDSYNGTKDDPITQNRYVYARDDPMRYVDPTGHMVVATDGGVTGSPAPPTTCKSTPDICATSPEASQTTTASTVIFTTNSPTLVKDVVNIVIDVGTLFLGPELKVVGATGLTNAIEQVIISGSELTPEVAELVKSVTDGNLAGIASYGLSVFGEAFTIALKSAPIFTRLALVGDIAFNAVGDVATAGGLEEANTLIGGAALAADIVKFNYDYFVG